MEGGLPSRGLPTGGGEVTPTSWKEHRTRQPDRKWHHTPLRPEWQTRVKTLPCPKLRLCTVTMRRFSWISRVWLLLGICHSMFQVIVCLLALVSTTTQAIVCFFTKIAHYMKYDVRYVYSMNTVYHRQKKTALPLMGAVYLCIMFALWELNEFTVSIVSLNSRFWETVSFKLCTCTYSGDLDVVNMFRKLTSPKLSITLGPAYNE